MGGRGNGRRHRLGLKKVRLRGRRRKKGLCRQFLYQLRGRNEGGRKKKWGWPDCFCPPLVSLHYFWAKMKKLGAQLDGCHGHDSSKWYASWYWIINKYHINIIIEHGMPSLHQSQINSTLREARIQHRRQTGSVGEWICDRKTAFIDEVSLIARRTQWQSGRPRNNHVELTV